MNLLRISCLLAGSLWSPLVLAVGLAEVTYPVFLPFNQGDQKIEVRPLPFATRHAHPEFIGAALSARYVVPHNDPADLPKDINVISACGVTIETGVAEGGREEDGVAVTLKIDLTGYAKPDHLPASDPEVIASLAEATLATLARHRCRLVELVIDAPGELSGLEERLRRILEDGGKASIQAGRSATAPEPGTEDGPQREPEPEEAPR